MHDCVKNVDAFRTYFPGGRGRGGGGSRVVERFKLRLRDALERIIKEKGGVPHSIIREAFLYWDVDASGRLDAGELVSLENAAPPQYAICRSIDCMICCDGNTRDL